MGSIFRDIRLAAVVVVLSIALGSCGISHIGQDIRFGGLESISLKGLTAVELSVGFSNESKYDLEMSEGVMEVYIDGKHIMRLQQVGTTISKRRSSDSITALWRINGVDPMALLSYANRFANRNFEGVTIDYSGKLKANNIGRTISGKGVVLSDFMDKITK